MEKKIFFKIEIREQRHGVVFEIFNKMVNWRKSKLIFERNSLKWKKKEWNVWGGKKIETWKGQKKKE